MKQLVMSERVFKSLTPEQQAGLQNIGALIDQMLQSGMADVQQTPAPPQKPPAQGQPPQAPPVGKELEGDQKKLRIGGLAQNEGSSMGKTPDAEDESEDETEKAENLGGKMKAMKGDLGQSEGKGFRGKSPVTGGGGGGELTASTPAGKNSPNAHPGNDGSSDAEGRIGDLPIYDEEVVEEVEQDGNADGEAPGGSNPTATKEQLLNAISRALGLGGNVRKSSDVRSEIREVKKAVEYLIQKLDPVGARAAGVMQEVEKALPVYRNDSTDDKSAVVLKALLGELQKANPKVFGTEGGDIATVRKALREEGLPALLGLAGQMWTGQSR